MPRVKFFLSLRYVIMNRKLLSATTTLMNTLKGGDHVLCVDDVYGGTQRFLRRILNPNS